MPITIETKKMLFNFCQHYVNKHIAMITEAMNAAQAAANEETKGSAGDKHETGRAMMHLEKEKNVRQLSGHFKLKKVLAQINPEETQNQVRLGCLVLTDNGTYFLSIPIGRVEIEKKIYFIISPVSPIGKILMNATVNSELNFNGKKINIEQIV